jgi:hypothetical protein
VRKTHERPAIEWTQPLSPREIVERAIRLANRPAYAKWLRLLGASAVFASAEAPEPEHVRRAVEWFQAALSDIAHERQTHEQIEAWRQRAKGLEPSLDYTIEGQHVRTTILWRAPQEVSEFKLPGMGPDWAFVIGTENAEALLASVLMWLLDPEQPFAPLHECGRGQQCERERFFFRNRKYCCTEHTQQVNQSTNTERSKDRRARDKAIEQLKPRFPKSARDLVWAVKARGLSAEDLVQRAIEYHEREKRQ